MIRQEDRDILAVRMGKPIDIFTPELIRQLYGMDSEITIDPRTGCPLIHYIPEYIA